MQEGAIKGPKRQSSPVSISPQEKTSLITAYRGLLTACNPRLSPAERKEVRAAFDLAMDAHAGTRRKSGELYIFHPIEVATICARDIGLRKTSIICALLHDVVEDTEVTLEYITEQFGEKVAQIINGLTKIGEVVGKSDSRQAENFRKILFTLADDVRVILIKMADRLHNMRTLDSMSPTAQIKIASETLTLFAPLAHRLGLYNIKSELEDLSLKYTEPQVYYEITSKLAASKKDRNQFIDEFIKPISKELKAQDFDFEIKGRPKSIYSIYRKMQRQAIPFEQVFDLFAVRVIIDTYPEVEKADCWKTYSIITDFYKPNPARQRDWVSLPKANGYESLHLTVMGPGGKWVEVQIRSRRMHDIAERGYAAHWKYKDGSMADNNLEEWLRKIREWLETPGSSAVEFIDDFRLNLFADEVMVFTPHGDLKTLPANSSALDFAFEIHSELGNNCLGAKVNQRLVPLDYRLQNGDQIEIISSKSRQIKPEWLDWVVTAKAKNAISQAIKGEEKQVVSGGKERLREIFSGFSVPFELVNIKQVVRATSSINSTDLYHRIGNGAVSVDELVPLVETISQNGVVHVEPGAKSDTRELRREYLSKRPKVFEIGDDAPLEYSIARCCNPIPGDEAFAFVSIADGVKIHRTSCTTGQRLLSQHGERCVTAQWSAELLRGQQTFLAGIRLHGIDAMGVVSQIADIISKQLKVNMQSITINSKAGAWEGSIILNITDADHLEELVEALKGIDGIQRVTRYYADENFEAESPLQAV